MLPWTLLIEPGGRRGAENMAADMALLRDGRPGATFLRLYRWAPPCLSFGRNESARRRYDAERIRQLGVDVVRRPTGGRAVWHDREVTYAVAGPATLFGSLRAAYEEIHRMLADAMMALGVPATLAARSRRADGLHAGACFATPAGGEVVAGGRKLIGSAQVREGSRFLQHGSILLSGSQNIVTQVTKGTGTAPHSTSLAEWIGDAATFEPVVDAVVEAASRRWTPDWRRQENSTLGTDPYKFEDPKWTWRR